MAFWSRLRQSQLKTLSYQLKKCQPFNTLNHTPLHTRIGIVNNPNLAIEKTQFLFRNDVRLFAAPVLPQKKQVKDTSGPRLNEKITAPVIRLVTDEGHIVLSRHESLERARRLKLDLVEVQRNAQPPVCRVMDYNKEKYKKQVKDKERSKTKSIDVKKGIVKEVRFTGQISPNDLQMKADTVKRLLEEGYRVKCMVTRKKEEDVGKMLDRFLVLIEEFSTVESGPRVEEKQAHLILRHVKLGSPKKAGREKVPKASKSSSADSEEAPAASTIRLSENDDGVKSSNLSDDESNWAAIDSNDDFDRVSDVGEGEEEPAVKFRESINSRSSIDAAGTHTASTTVQSPPVRENRYSREPRNSSQPSRPIDGYGPGANNTRLQPPFVDPRRQPQLNINASPLKREAFQREAQASRYTNAGVPANNFSNQNSSRLNTPGSGAPGFGVFNAPRAENPLEKQNRPTEVNNRYQKVNAPPPARNSSSTGFSGDRNSTVSNSTSRGPINNNDVQGKFGIFSPKTSNVIPNRNAENQVKRIAETLDSEIKRWAAGKEGNLRALLSTLQYVLWPECGWQPVSLTDLITGANVKKVYRKATLCIHPDKVQQKGATLQQKYIAEKVFDLLKEAWNKLNSEELF